MTGDGATRSQVVLAGKDAWYPPLSREHALIALAARSGHAVIFSERPTDVRALLRGEDRAGYLRRLTTPRLIPSEIPGVRYLRRSVVLPGHRGKAAAYLAGGALRHSLAGLTDHDTVMIANVPWDWPVLAKSNVRRRVFDVGDDWQSMVPGGRRRFARYYEMIAAEADQIIVTNAALGAQFHGREVITVPNAVWPESIGAGELPRDERTMIYVGTLSERFDSDLLMAVLERLPDWRLEIVGGCKYAKLGDRPAPELQRLLAMSGRVRWHGELLRPAALEIVDRCGVALIPNRPAFAGGQDSMKLYDYSGRGLPIVASSMAGLTDAQLPPGFAFATDPDDFARAVMAAADLSPMQDEARRAWARGNTWESRWPQWSAALFGASESL